MLLVWRNSSFGGPFENDCPCLYRCTKSFIHTVCPSWFQKRACLRALVQRMPIDRSHSCFTNRDHSACSTVSSTGRTSMEPVTTMCSSRTTRAHLDHRVESTESTHGDDRRGFAQSQRTTRSQSQQTSSRPVRRAIGAVDQPTVPSPSISRPKCSSRTISRRRCSS